eukprot:688913-Prymnesium_polylepis.1
MSVPMSPCVACPSRPRLSPHVSRPRVVCAWRPPQQRRDQGAHGGRPGGAGRAADARAARGGARCARDHTAGAE